MFFEGGCFCISGLGKGEAINKDDPGKRVALHLMVLQRVYLQLLTILKGVYVYVETGCVKYCMQ